MPFDWRRQDCTQADGTQGRWVVFDENTSEQQSCHVTKRDAQAASRIANQESKDVETSN